MSRYITWEKVVGRYQDAAKIADASAMGSYWLHHAEDEIDAMLSPRYSVPFTGTISHVVQDLCIDLAYYKMTWRQESADKLYKYIEKRVDKLINGTMVLTDSSGSQLASNGDVPWSTTQDYSATFGVDNVLNWAVSSLAMMDAETSRD